MPKFKITIGTKWFYKLGSPVEIAVKIKNITKRDYYILVRNTPLGNIHTDCFMVTCGKEAVKYDSIHVKRGEITEKSFMLVKSGETIKTTMPLAERYLFEKGGKVELHYKPELVYTAYIDEFRAYMRKESLEPVKKSFFILGRKRIYPTKGIRMRFEERKRLIRNEEVKTENVEYPEPDISLDEIVHPHENKNEFIKMVKQSHYEMIHYLIHCVAELKADRKGENLHYQMIFGQYDADRYKKVQEVYDKVLRAVHNVQAYERNTDMTTDPSGESMEDCYGYIIDGGTTVYLCKLYLEAKLSGTDSRLGVIFHELSHAYAETEDVEIGGVEYYGRRRCRNLAVMRPDKAIENADSYEFFLETKFINWMGEEEWIGCRDIDETACGGPSMVMQDDLTLLFYTDEKSCIKMSIYDGKAYTVPEELRKAGDVIIQSKSQPEAVIFKDNLYVFYIPKGGNALHYTYKIADKWAEGIPVVWRSAEGEKTSIEPLYTPHPVIYQGELVLIYRKREEETLFMTSWNGDRWKTEVDVPNSTYFAKTVCYNPAVAVYRGILYAIYTCHGSTQINYASYNPDTDSWKMDNKIIMKGKQGGTDTLYAETASEIRAVTANDNLYLTFLGLDGELWQIQMNAAIDTGEKVFTDYEPVFKSSVGEYLPQTESLCSYGCNGRYRYIIYRGISGGVFMSIQMPV